MKLTPEQIADLAHLSRLDITGSAIDDLATEMSKIMAMVEQVQQINTSELSQIVHIHDQPQPLRDDQSVPVTQHLASGAKAEHNGFVVVPKVIE